MKMYRSLRHLTRVLLFLAPALLLSTVAFAAAPNGKAQFMKEKCNMCHSVPGAGIKKTMKAMKAPDLSGAVVAKQANLKEFLLQKAEIKGKKHPKKISGGEAEVDAIIGWLKAQK